MATIRTKCRVDEDESTRSKFKQMEVFFFYTLLKSWPMCTCNTNIKPTESMVQGDTNYKAPMMPMPSVLVASKSPSLQGQLDLNDRKCHHSRDADLVQGPNWASTQSLI